MKAYRPNLGQQFAKPYESSHNMVRRCLIANPGIPLSTIESDLRALIPEPQSVAKRLQTLQFAPQFVRIETRLRDTYTRQCPRCAQSLYHTDIYAAPWLSHCPIHHCALADTCPGCLQPWPDTKALASRDCPICGRLSFEQLISHVFPSADGMDYRPIEELYQFIRRGDCANEAMILTDYFGEIPIDGDWWNDSGITGPLFPAYCAMSGPTLTKERLQSLHVLLRPIRKRSSRIRPVDAEHMRAIRPRAYALNAEVDEHAQRRAPLDYQTMKYILEWIWRQTPPQHQVRISSYRHLDLEHFLRGPEPCPFCLALSLWFFDVAARIFGRYYVDDIDNYPFLIQGGGSGFCDAEDPYLWTPHNGQYALDVRFANWFYGWNMEIVFARLFLFCEALACHVRTLGREHERRRIASADSALGFYHGDGFPGQACVIEYVHDKLNFYYESEHPITTCSVFRNEELSRECGRYHRYLFETLDVVEPFDYEVRTNEFSFEVFLSLMSKFIHFLQDRLSTKGRGNIEKGLCPLVPHSDRSRDSAPGRRTSHQLQNRYMVGAEFRALMVEGRDPGPERAKRFPDGLADLGAPWHG